MKKKPSKPYNVPDNSLNVVNDPVGLYLPSSPKNQAKQLLVKDFLYKDFKRIADKAPFTLSEWANILHISERTLHRYAVSNTAFNGLQIEIILLIDKLIVMGTELFGRKGFEEWLSSSVFTLGGKSPKEFLTSYAGIQEVIRVVGRIQHGISA